MEKLQIVYNNSNNTDNIVLIRVLNTFLENKNELKPEYIVENIGYFVECFKQLIFESSIDRPRIKYVVNEITDFNKEIKWSKFLSLIRRHHKKNMKNYKNLFIIVFCRAVFEMLFQNRLHYTMPVYAIKIAYGENAWNIFLQSLEINNDNIYMVNEN